jgi:integrase
MSVQRRQTARKGVVWDVRLRDPEGRVYTRTFPTKKEALNYEAEQRTGRSKGTWTDPRRSERKFEEVGRWWLSSNPGKRGSSYARDESVLRVHLLPVLGERTIGSIAKPDVQAIVNGWAATHAPRSVKRMYGVLRAIFNAAVDADYISRTPCRRIALPQVHPKPASVITGGDLAAMAQSLGSRLAPMIYVGAVLGLRWGEVAGLRVGRIDFARYRLTVAEQVTRGKGGATVIEAPKSDAGRRTLSIPPPLAEMLRDHLLFMGLDPFGDAEALVFSSPNGQPLEYSDWRRRVWVPAMERVGLGKVGFHDLRRLNATAMVLDGTDVKTAQTRLGHSDPRLTLAIYAQATTEGDRLASDRLGARFFPAPTTAGPQPGLAPAPIPQIPQKMARDERAMTSRRRRRSKALQAREQGFQDSGESGRRDLNPRPQRPERCALTKLRYFPLAGASPAPPMVPDGALTTTLPTRRRSISATRSSQPS